MSDVFIHFIVYLFYFQMNKNITIFCWIESTFYRNVTKYQTHDSGKKTVPVFNIYNKNNLQHLSIFYNISIFSFQSLCEVNALPEIYSIFIFKSVFAVAVSPELTKILLMKVSHLFLRHSVGTFYTMVKPAHNTTFCLHFHSFKSFHFII